MPTIRAIVKQAESKQFRLSALILGVVQSPAFRTARAEGTISTGR
jgi:hypothetical protein